MTTIYTTVPPSFAPKIATVLVEERLAACVNRFECRSTYRWDGEIVRDEETALLIKTTEGEYDAVEARIKKLHPHDVPCIERFDETDRTDAFDAWIAENVR